MILPTSLWLVVAIIGHVVYKAHAAKTEVCTASFETSCSVITAQNMVLKIAGTLSAATNQAEVNMVYHNVTYSASFKVKGGFYGIVTEGTGWLATGAVPSYVNHTIIEKLILGSSIVTNPQLAMAVYSAGLGNIWVDYLWSNPGQLPYLKRSYAKAVTLFNGRQVVVACGYSVIDPDKGVSACSPKSFETCSTIIATTLVDYTYFYVNRVQTSADWDDLVTKINTRVRFLVFDGFYPFIVNASNGGKFVASGGFPEHIGSTWSEMAVKVGATTSATLDATLNDVALTMVPQWLQFLWVGANNEDDCYKNVYMQPFEYQGNLYYVGVAVNDPNPFIVYADYAIPNSIRVANYFVGALTAVIYALCAGVVKYYQRSVLIRMSSPRFLLWMLFGAVWLTLTSILYIEFPTTNGDATICNCRFWLFPIGLSFLITPILSKTVRAAILVNSLKKRSNMTGFNMFLATCALIVPVLIIQGANWSGNPPTIDTHLMADPTNTNLSQCIDSPNTYGLLMAYFGILIAACYYSAYKIRNAPDGFNESSYIYSSCSFLTVYAVLIIPVQFLLMESPQARSVLLSFSIQIGTLVFAGAIVFPKLYHIYRNEHNDKNLMSTQTYQQKSNSTSTGTPSTIHPQKIYADAGSLKQHQQEEEDVNDTEVSQA